MINSTEPVASTARNHQCVDQIDRWQQPSDESTTKQDFIIADFKSFTQGSNWTDKRYCEWRILGCLKWRISYYMDGGWLYLHMEFDQCRLHGEWNVDVEWYVRITVPDDANEIYENGPYTTQFSNIERSRWLTRFYPYQYKEDGYTVEDRIAVTVEMNFRHIKIDHGLLEIVERITNLERLVMEVKKEQETQAAKVEELRNDFDSSFTVRNTQMANLEQNVTNLVEEMRDGLEQQAAEAYERFERLQRQLENVSAFLQKLLMTNKKPESAHQRGSLSSNEESSLGERAKSPDSFSSDMCSAQQKRFSSPFIRL